jgi:hypothetical protein
MRLRPAPKKPDPLEKLLGLAEYREVPITIVQHAKAVPLGVMVRGTLEWLLDEPILQKLFQDHAPEQYTRELTLSALVKLLIQVSAGVRASVYAAYKVDQEAAAPSITTSFQALYAKMGRINPAVSEALVRHSADQLQLQPVLKEMPAAADEPIPGYRLRILDGNVLTGTEHRLTALRRWLNACLPGKSLVVYEPALGLVTDLVLCEDAYTQERALLVQLLPRVCANDLWLADRNFCTTKVRESRACDLRKAGQQCRQVAFVGNTDEVVAQTELADDFGRTWQERDSSHRRLARRSPSDETPSASKPARVAQRRRRS